MAPWGGSQRLLLRLQTEQEDQPSGRGAGAGDDSFKSFFRVERVIGADGAEAVDLGAAGAARRDGMVGGTTVATEDGAAAPAPDDALSAARRGDTTGAEEEGGCFPLPWYAALGIGRVGRGTGPASDICGDGLGTTGLVEGM